MRKMVLPVLGIVLAIVVSNTALAQFTAFNDFYRSTETHANATEWNSFGAAGSTGLLKDITTGQNLGVTLTVSSGSALEAGTGAKPNAGSPAYTVFNTPVNYIDWTNSANNAIQLQGSTPMSDTISGLNPSKRYRLTVTGARNGNYPDRWTTFELSGASYFAPAHSSGCLTNGSTGVPAADITPSQCVINTGNNVVGDIAFWDEIDPGADGTIIVYASTYRGTVPAAYGGSSGGSYGYGIHALKLEEYNPVPTPVSFALQPVDRTANENQSATFTAVANGTPRPTYQWYENDNPIANATNSFFTINNLSPGQNGYQYYVVAQNTVDSQLYTLQSTIVSLTVVPDLTPPTLLGAFSSSTLTNVTVMFSEPVSELTATNTTNYVITSSTTGAALNINRAVVMLNLSNVTLNTGPQSNGATYILTINGIKDRTVAGNSIAANSYCTFVAQANLAVTNLGGATPVGVLTVSEGGVDLTGGGSDLGGTSDLCQFAYQTRNGDFDIQVRVAGLSLSDIWAKASLMARSAVPMAPNSVFAASVATPAMSGCFFESRTTSGGTATSGGFFPVNYPYTWLRLQRTNLTTFRSYASADGSSWSLLGSALINMGDPVAVGLGLSSGSNAPAATAQFREFGDAVAPSSASYWSMPNEPLGPSSRKTCIAITEIMYKPAPRGDTNNLEFIELFNSNPYYEDLSGWRISGDVDFTFPANTVMQGGTFLVLARDPAAIQTVYGINNVLGPYTNSLKVPGTIRLRDNRDAVLLEVNYADQPPWPAAADGAGHSLVLARPSYGEGQVQAWDISDRIGGSPGKTDGANMTPLRNVVINEFLASTTDEAVLEDYIELYNHSSQPVDITGCILTDNAQTNTFVIPSHTIPAHGFAVFYRHELNFGLDDNGETIYLKNPQGTRVLDAVRYDQQAPGIASGRFPDGAGEFYLLTSRTPGDPNSSILINDIVINEIMYDPISWDDNDQYVELYNKGTNTISLAGWKFVSGISYTFPSTAVLAPDSYLVVAKNPTLLLANYKYLSNNLPLGPYSGKLAGGGERLALAMVDLETNSLSPLVIKTNHVVVDEVTYGTGGNWPKWANRSGSSLELVDPRSNHRLAHNWVASDETQKAPWTTVEYVGPMVFGSDGRQGPPTAGTDAPDWLEILALGEGEFLVDDVELIEMGSTNILLGDAANFNSSPSNWVHRGTQFRSGWDATGGMGDTGCLHIRASTRGDTMGNRSLATLPRAVTITNITLRAKVRWLCGFPEMYLRLHGNWAEAAGRMVLPNNLGTPGLPNSRRLTNGPPAIYEARHFPVIPAANQPVVVTARAHDMDGLSAVTLNYRLDPNSTVASVPMLDDGTAGDAVAGDGIYSGTIPGQSSGTMVAFTVVATDTLGASQTFPLQDATYTNPRECLVRFDDPIIASSFGIYRQWVSQANVNEWQNRPALSNDKIYETFVYGNFRAIYNAAVKWSGSPYHQFTGSPVSVNAHYAIDMPEDDLLLGTTTFNKIHAPGNGAFDDPTTIREQTSYWFARKLGCPWNYRRFVNMFINGNRRGGTTTLMEDSEVPNGDLIASRWPDDQDGFLFKLQPWFEQADGTAQNDGGSKNRSWCMLNKITYTNGNVRYLQPRYRQTFLARGTHNSINDTYTNVYNLCAAASTPTTNNFAGWNAAFESLVDTEEWVRIFAVEHAVGNWDSFGNRNSQNMYGYKPENGKWTLLIWDLNIVLGAASGPDAPPFTTLFQYQTLDTNMPNFYVNNPKHRRAYWRALKELTSDAMVNANCDPFMDARYNALVASGIGVASPAPVKTWISSARSSILSLLAADDATNFVVNATNIITGSNNNYVVLSGFAPVEMKTLKINGLEYRNLVWTSVKTWTVTLPVNAASNLLTLQGYDVYGNTLSNFSGTVSVVNTGAVAQAIGTVVFNEIMYNPTNADSAYLEIYNRSTNFTFDISGWRINGLGYTFPGGSFITNGQYLTLAKNRTAFANNYGSAIPAFDVFDGKLDLDGETLSLIQPGLTTNDTDLVIDKVRYEAARPWPSLAPGASIQLLDAAQDNVRVGNWSAGAQWRYYSFTGNPGSLTNTYQNLYLYPDANGCDVYLDDIRLVLGTNAQAGTNLLRNGDFENGSNTFWIIKSPGSTATNSVNHSGSYSFHLYSLTGANPNNSGLYQNFSNVFVQNTNYTVSYWYLSNFKGSNLYAQIGPTTRYKGVNNNISAVPFTPGTANSVATTLPEFPPLWLNEVQPKNVNTRADSLGQFSPWVELYNPSSNEVELTGLYLANNYSTNLLQWAFPTGAVISAGEFKVIWLDGAESNSTLAELHANFTIPESTGSVALVRVFNSMPQVVDYLTYSGVGAALSYGDYPDGQPFSRQTFYRVSPGETNNAEHPTIFINEWMAANSALGTNGIAGVPNPIGGGYDDWFELYNPNDYPVNLNNFFLTDTNAIPTQYQIPAGYSVPAHGFLLVWADGKPGRNTNTSPDLHINFNLGKEGEQIALYDGNTNLIDLVTFGVQTNNISQGRWADGAQNFYYMANPTPGQGNIYFVNTAPTLAPTADRVATAGQTLWVTNVATDVDVARTEQVLTWHLGAGAPVGMFLYSASGLIRWTPMVRGTNHITIWVEDNGVPRLSATNTFTVVVQPANSPPSIPSISDQVVSLGQTLSVLIPASDPDSPPQVLTYSLEPGAPLGTAIDPVTGRFTWTPTADQVPSTSQVTVRVADNGSPSLSTTRAFTLIAVQSSENRPPVLGTLTNHTVLVGETISFTVPASDPDAPPQVLAFSLDEGSPAGASINPTSGLFTWTPTNAPSSTNIGVRVTDNGTPALSVGSSFTVTVLPMALSITNDGTSIILSCQSVPGRHYKLEAAGALGSPTTWQDVPGYSDVNSVSNSLSITLPLETSTNRFYHVQLIVP